MKIYGDTSRNCLKVKGLHNLALPYEWVGVDTLKGETAPSVSQLNGAGPGTTVVTTTARDGATNAS